MGTYAVSQFVSELLAKSSNRMNPPLLLATGLDFFTFFGLTLHSTLQDRNNKTSANGMERKLRDAPGVTPNLAEYTPLSSKQAKTMNRSFPQAELNKELQYRFNCKLSYMKCQDN